MQHTPSLWVTFALLSSAKVVSAKPHEPLYQFKLSKPQDSIVLEKQAERSVFTISSLSGIGGVTLILKSGHWPKTVVFRLQHFKVVEGMHLLTSRLFARGYSRIEGQVPFWWRDADGLFSQDVSATGTLDIKFEQREGGLEIIMPPHLFAGSKEISFGWIDYYR